MAIVLITFVVVASVFAFAVLTTGLRTATKSQEVARGGLEQSAATLAVRGGVVGYANPSRTALNTVKFTLTTGGKAAEFADLSDKGTLVSYLDQDQARNLSGSQWSATWLTGSGPVLDHLEAAELEVALVGLSPLLGPGKDFGIRVHPIQGSVLLVKRTTPLQFSPVVKLAGGTTGPVPQSLDGAAP